MLRLDSSSIHLNHNISAIHYISIFINELHIILRYIETSVCVTDVRATY